MPRCPFAASASRRSFLRGASVAAGGMLGSAAPSVTGSRAETSSAAGRERFWGARQAGIVTPPQAHTYFAAFDVLTAKRAELAGMLRRWTALAASLAEGESGTPQSDSLDALDLPPSRLTLTFGFGPSLFEAAGKDRFGLAPARPEALVDMPAFHGDQLVEARTGGDLSVQACADDPQVAFHAIRRLTTSAYGLAQLRWAQAGFCERVSDGGAPRNLMGFKDGTQTPFGSRTAAGAAAAGAADRDGVLWVRDEGPEWLRGGSYLVARRIRISLEHWDRTETDFQEEVIGRRKRSGAPLSGGDEFTALDLDAADSEGNPVIPETAHVRLATARSNDGAQIHRRAYAYNDGATFTAERWPPWRQGMLYDAGLFFLCYQRDPRTGFIRIFAPMAQLDALNQFTTHTGGGLFACPPGAIEGGYIGQALLEG